MKKLLFIANHRFNPLERGNSNQIRNGNDGLARRPSLRFQSPRTGKFESNMEPEVLETDSNTVEFQSPRTGKFESNLNKRFLSSGYPTVSIP